MSSVMQVALWLVLVIVSSAFCYHFGSSMSAQANTAVCRESKAAAAFSDARRALEMVSDPESQPDAQAHLTNLRIAVFRLGEIAPEVRDWNCSEEDRALLAAAGRALQEDPSKPEWMDAKIAPALALCAAQG